MFNIYGRHSPVFSASEVRAITDILGKMLGLEELLVGVNSGVRAMPPHQTARINETNEIIFKSDGNREDTLSYLTETGALDRVATSIGDSEEALATLTQGFVEAFGVDSYVSSSGSRIRACERNSLGVINEGSRKTLMIYDSVVSLLDRHELLADQQIDHPVIWVNREFIPTTTDGADAFFALSPVFKLEVSLNRFELLAEFGGFACGLIR